MTDLTFAIEAAKRGCSYVDNAFTYMRFKPSDPNSMAGTFYSIENATPYTRFIIGATSCQRASSCPARPLKKGLENERHRT